MNFSSRLSIAVAGLATFVASGVGLQAQGLADIVLCDPINEQIFRLTDLDGDGFYLSPSEANIFVDMSVVGAVNPDTAEMRIEGGNATIYWVIDSPDSIYRAQDGNGNGTIDITEMTVFFDAATIIGSVNNEGLEVTSDGAVWFTANYNESFTGLVRLQDANGDGDANDAGEYVVMVDGSSQITVDTDTGPALAYADDYWRMTAAGNGVITYHGFSTANLTSEDSLFRFEDVNADGDVTDAGESRLFLNYTGKNAGFPQSPEFTNGSFPSLVLPNASSPSTPYYGRLNHLTEQDEGGVTAFYMATDASNTSSYSVNVNGLSINGLIFRAVDLDGDGDVNDAGEVGLFYDGSLTGPMPITHQFDKVLGIDANGGYVYVSDLGNGQRIVRLRDLNGDGDAMDQGVDIGGGVLQDEMELDLWSFGLWGPNPPFPALGPFVEDMATIDGGVWGAGCPGILLSGTGCSQYGSVPTICGSGTANAGTANFTCTVGNAGANLPALLHYGTSTAVWFGVPLPLDLTPFGYSGCTLYHNIVGNFATVTDPSGNGSVPVPIPNDPVLVGFVLPLQWLVVDFQANGIALSPLGQVTIQP